MSGFEKPQTKCKFDAWANPSVALSPEAEHLLGVTNAQLAKCRSTDVVLEDFLHFTRISSARDILSIQVKH